MLFVFFLLRTKRHGNFNRRVAEANHLRERKKGRCWAPKERELLPIPEASGAKGEGARTPLLLEAEGGDFRERTKRVGGLSPAHLLLGPLLGAIISGGFAQGLHFYILFQRVSFCQKKKKVN